MSGKKHIKTWVERCEEHPDHNGIVSERMIKARMQEEIDELREEYERLREALAWAYNLRHLRGHSDPVVIPERFAPLIEDTLRREET